MYSFTVEEALLDRFSPGTTQRSVAYRAGFEYKLRRLIEGAAIKDMPYKIGTPEADAFFSGEDHATEYCKARTKDPLYE